MIDSLDQSPSLTLSFGIRRCINNMKSTVAIMTLVLTLHQVAGTTFNAEAQRVSTTGEHKFVPPGKGDQRGVCPGLNALANHNYLPHNGVASIEQFIKATTEVYGMGLDLATLLSVYGAAFDGNLTHFSIHNIPKIGLSDSHNNYESDASPTRCDFFKCGRRAFKLQPDQYKALYDLGENITLSKLEKLRVARFQDSINTNPFFFNGIFSGVFVQPAAYTFIYRFMANKSSEFPEGYLNRDVLGSFFSVRIENGSFIYTPGHERIPDNWYKRALDDPYTIPFFLLDVVKMAANHPEFLSIGGNTNGVNTFTGVDPANLTDGLYNLKNLLDPKNLMCFILQFSQQGPQPLFQQLGIAFNAALAAIARLFGNLSSKFGCPQLLIDPVLYEGYLMNYPGWMRSLHSTVR